MLVSVRDLMVYMDISFSNRQQDAAEMVLAGLQSELEAYLRRPIEPTEFVEEYRIDSGYTGVPMSSFLSVDKPWETSFNVGNTVSTTTYAQPPTTIYLRNTPVVEITEVKVKPLYQDEQILNPEEQYVVRRFGIDYYYATSDDLVTITYTAGLDGESIPVFKLMILRAATREVQNMHDDVVGLKDLNTRNVAPLETGFMEKELMALRKYRRVRVA